MIKITKKNFKIKKTDMLTSKIGYTVRKKKQQISINWKITLGAILYGTSPGNSC